jgi:hypothetical protein
MTSHQRCPSSRRSSLACALLLALAAARPATAVTIDDFSVGPITLTRTGATAAAAQQTGLDPNHVLGGARDITVGASGGDAGQSVTIDTAARQLQFTIDTSLGYFDLVYGSMAQPLNVDLTADGSDAFRIDFSKTGSHISLQRLSVFTAGADGTLSGSNSNVLKATLPDGRVRVEYPFSAFPGVNFSAVERIGLGFVRVSNADDPVILGIVTVPEPAASTLLAVGAVALCRCRRLRSPQR